MAAYKADTGQDLEFTYGGTPDPEGVETQNFIKTMFEEAGMKVSTYTVEQTQYINVAVARNFQMYGWRNFPGSDPTRCSSGGTATTRRRQPCDNLVNFGGFNDPMINSDLQKGRSEVDPAKRKALYEDLNREFAEGAVQHLDQLDGVGRRDDREGAQHLRHRPAGRQQAEPRLGTGHPMSGLFVTP